MQNAEQQRKAHDERQQSRRRDHNGANEGNSGESNSAENNSGENSGTETSSAESLSEEKATNAPAEEKSDAEGQSKTSDLSDEEASAGVKKMVAAGRPRKPRTSKKTQEAAATDSPEGDDASEAVA